MPKKKTPINGFSMFMQEIRQEMARQGRGFGMEELVAYARPRWKDLSDEQQLRYNDIAKAAKQKNQSKPDDQRMDNQGNIIARREDSEAELSKRRLKERKIASSRWPDVNDILDYPFYFISFEVMCELNEGTAWLPLEIGIVEWSLELGITKRYHKFIDPGDIPLGYRYESQKHSEETHQIPIEGFEQASKNYRGIYMEIENFINPSGSKEEYPPMYAFAGGSAQELRRVDYCVKWIHERAAIGHVNRLKVYTLDDMVADLYKLKQGKPISESSISSMLITTTWDYDVNTRCPFHEELQTKCCALGTVNRYAYALADAMKLFYGFELTENHLPVQNSDEPAYVVIPPSAVSFETRPSRYRNQPTSYGSKSSSYKNPSTAYTSASQGAFGGRDYRYQTYDDDEDNDDDKGTATSYAASTVSSYSDGPKIAPWASAAAIASILPPSISSDSDFPSLGGPGASTQNDYPPLGNADSVQNKFAGRTIPPDASVLPRPSWQSSFSDSKPSGPKGKSLREAVQEREREEQQQQQQQIKPAQSLHSNAPGVAAPISYSMGRGRGIRPAGPAKVNASFNPNQAFGSAPRVALPCGSTPQSSPGHRLMGQPFQPDCSNSALQSDQGGPPASLAQAMQRPSESSSVMEPSSSVQKTAAVNPARHPPTPGPRLPGVGRGLALTGGIARKAAGGSGMAAPPVVTTAPPGFGRGGISSQFQGMALDK